MHVEVDAEREKAARAAVERVLSEYADVFGPTDDGRGVMVDAWVVASYWQDLEEGGGVTVVNHSGCAYPMRVGLFQEGIDSTRSDD